MPRRSRSRRRRGSGSMTPKQAIEMLKAKTQAHDQNVVGLCYLPKNEHGEYDGSKRNCKPLIDAMEAINKGGLGGDGFKKKDKKVAGAEATRAEWFARHCVPHGKYCEHAGSKKHPKPGMTDTRHGLNKEVSQFMRQMEHYAVDHFKTTKKAAHGNHGHTSGEAHQAGDASNISNADKALVSNRGGIYGGRRRKSRRKKRRKSKKRKSRRKRKRSRRRRRR